MRLLSVADVRAGTYSGGMKRRLSLVIATIGDPKIIFLDGIAILSSRSSSSSNLLNV